MSKNARGYGLYFWDNYGIGKGAFDDTNHWSTPIFWRFWSKEKLENKAKELENKDKKYDRETAYTSSSSEDA